MLSWMKGPRAHGYLVLQWQLPIGHMKGGDVGCMRIPTTKLQAYCRGGWGAEHTHSRFLYPIFAPGYS
jgi:hypothetical protein